MIGQFNMNNIDILQKLGYEVHIGCNFEDRSVWTKERVTKFKDDVNNMNIICHQIDFARSPLGIGNDIKSFKQMDKLFKENNFEFVHCHTPVAGVISRLVAHIHGVKTIYTAHGFHFYDGAPKKNWIIFYPIEKFFSRWTDILITITREDYKRASEKFHAKEVKYVPGVGVDISKFSKINNNREQLRKSLNVDDDELMLLSVGELNENKNHSSVIKALGELRDKRIKYYIAGNGHLKEYLVMLAKERCIDNKIVLLGFRSDIPELMQAADIYILPSIREGLNVSLMEAMASGLPCLCGNIRGNIDLIEEKSGGYLFNANSINSIKEKISLLIDDSGKQKMKDFNQNKVNSFSKDVVSQSMKALYIQISKTK